MEQEIILKEHNKTEYPQMQAMIFSTNFIKLCLFILLFTTLASGNKSYAQSDIVVSYVNNPFTENDTLFLDRYTAIVNGDTLTQSRFVVPANSSENKKRQSDLLATSADGRWRNNWQDIDYIEVFSRQYGPLRHFNLQDFPREWCYIKVYQGKPYRTCDYPYQIFFTDSVVISDGMDWNVDVLTSFNKLKDGAFSYSLLNYRGDEITETIRPIKNINGLYIRITSGYGVTSYSILVPMSQVDQFDFIDMKNWFDSCPTYEIEYDEINTLLKDGTIKY